MDTPVIAYPGPIEGMDDNQWQAAGIFVQIKMQNTLDDGNYNGDDDSEDDD